MPRPKKIALEYDSRKCEAPAQTELDRLVERILAANGCVSRVDAETADLLLAAEALEAAAQIKEQEVTL